MGQDAKLNEEANAIVAARAWWVSVLIGIGADGYSTDSSGHDDPLM